MPWHSPLFSRRQILGTLAAANVLAAESHGGPAPVATAPRLKQSVSRWPFARVALPEFCHRARQIGLAGIDLLFPDEWAVARDAGLTVSMGYASRREKFIETGFNDPAHHSMLIEELANALPLAARDGVPNLIAMFGNRIAGIDDATAVAHCITGLSRVAPLAEQAGVTVCVELLNSKVDHAGYQGDHTAFGAAVMHGVHSPRVKLLYDVYHMQIMEGDVIRTIRANIDWIGHLHTGGVPGRNEIDDSQELNYRAIAMTLAELRFPGYLAHEFVPTRADPFASLTQAYDLCNV